MVDALDLPVFAVHECDVAVDPATGQVEVSQDGTGDAPVPRPHPGDASTDASVQQGYVDYWVAHGAPSTLQYSDLTCAPPTSSQPGYQQPGFDTYTTMPFQGAIGELGVHYFLPADSDNDFTGIPLDELDAEVWVYPVPLAQPENLISATTSATGRDYGLNVQAPLQTAVTPFNGPAAATPETPLAALLPVAAAFAVLIGRRRRSRPA